VPFCGQASLSSRSFSVSTLRLPASPQIQVPFCGQPSLSSRSFSVSTLRQSRPCSHEACVSQATALTSSGLVQIHKLPTGQVCPCLMAGKRSSSLLTQMSPIRQSSAMVQATTETNAELLDVVVEVLVDAAAHTQMEPDGQTSSSVKRSSAPPLMHCMPGMPSIVRLQAVAETLPASPQIQVPFCGQASLSSRSFSVSTLRLPASPQIQVPFCGQPSLSSRSFSVSTLRQSRPCSHEACVSQATALTASGV